MMEEQLDNTRNQIQEMDNVRNRVEKFLEQLTSEALEVQHDSRLEGVHTQEAKDYSKAAHFDEKVVQEARQLWDLLQGDDEKE